MSVISFRAGTSAAFQISFSLDFYSLYGSRFPKRITEGSRCC
ncbi:hypothetical protein CFter6_4838 [Collimonas fungivorans]|uniref:Uncharacterized protein n=1 Tax=Collimonas fungivorans TaxID=158899 RepID=A0A127PI59_9BURK|nr:hypothetical protein CFter6_4838 [Collimonas fungivorans]